MDNTARPAYSGDVIRRLTSLLVLTVFAVTPLAASSVTILLDASFSMSLPEGESTRLEALTGKLRTWMGSQPADTRYALLLAEHGSTPVSELPYPATRDQVSAALDDIVPWGSVDLGASIRTAADLASSIAAASGDATARLSWRLPAGSCLRACAAVRIRWRAEGRGPGLLRPVAEDLRDRARARGSRHPLAAGGGARSGHFEA